MAKSQHYQSLQNMYLAAPINQLYQPTIAVTEGRAAIRIQLQEAYYHSAGAVHGSVYFKMLDDAAFFAASSLETEFFVLTASFTTYLVRPVATGTMRSEGRVVNQSKTQFIAESIAYNAQNKVIARGNGLFVRGRHPLKDALGYGVR
ncbi:MAG: PaaI family thioesterase [Sedimenticola selenatireducens]|uniref:PaaI family thioesterase n=1 Tax=Sedimenticola selenatireducens TaxID=191960 RepID=A0A557RWN9_9GAMM|nr:PaaI family thioesterase [Sedimenticola selenatireducens]TVT61946.1 MAG: PaaI family thioesterase [Sedimenticola selenatireducens]